MASTEDVRIDLPESPGRIAVAISGAGRTLKNLLEKQSDCPYRVVGVIISRECSGASIAVAAGLPVFRGNVGADEPSRELQEWLDALNISWVALAGYLKIFPSNFCRLSRSVQVVNIHPSLLPRHGGQGMYGVRVHQKVIECRDEYTGASVHFADSQYDQGRVIAQVALPVVERDTAELLAQKVFDRECELYPQVLSRLVTGRLPLPGDQVWKMEIG